MPRLTSTARTILRSRVRRHPDTPKLVDVRKVASMSAADLVQTAALLRLDVPSPAECTPYTYAKARGESGRDALAASDAFATTHGFGGTGMAALLPATSAAPADGADGDTDADDTDDTDAGDTPDTAATDDGAASLAASDASNAVPGDPAASLQIGKAADAAVSNLMGAFGRGDLVGFQRGIRALAIKAVTPPPPPIVQIVRIPAPYDTSKVKGHVPTVVAHKTLTQVGIAAPAVTRPDAAALDVYDAPDAPAINSGYAWPTLTGALVAALRRGRSVMLYGPAGTGKTEFAQQIAARYGRPFVRVSCDDQTEAATLTGMTVPDGHGGVTWRDGQLACAIRRPGTVVLIDEPSVARPGALFVLQALLDGDKALHVQETGEVIPAAPGVLFILSDNTNGTGDADGQYEGTRRLNRAFLDRQAVTARFEYLPADQEADVLAKLSGCSGKQAGVLVRFGNATRRAADKGALSHGLGLRRLTALAEQIADGVDPAVAVQITCIETAPHDDREPLRQLWTAEITPEALRG